METETHGETGLGWGVAWFLWNGPISVAVISMAQVLLSLTQSLASGETVDIRWLVGGVLLAGPCYSSLAWMGGSALIAAAWATGARNGILVRLLVAVVSALLAIPAFSEDAWVAAFFICSGLGLAVSLRLPTTPAHQSLSTGVPSVGCDTPARPHLATGHAPR
ncbi:hypothetical protein [Micromonospora chokoriensis]|uniref:hypothetical protein n=1 Tax=Micromonospora chokoriensis TaxID=356851 RepID=UPI0012FA3A68|nr:hypothetical protein [Micromonospora chokoriensis]